MKIFLVGMLLWMLSTSPAFAQDTSFSATAGASLDDPSGATAAATFEEASSQQTAPENDFFDATVLRVVEESKELGDRYQKLEVEFTSGPEKGKTRIIEKNRESALSSARNFDSGDQIILTKLEKLNGEVEYVIAEYNRTRVLVILAVIFAAFTILVGKWKGFRSLLSLGFSFLVLFYFVIPQILKGTDPVVVTILGSLIILTSLLYITHGVNLKTTSAVIGTTLSLIVTGILTIIFVNMSKLTGLSEDALFVQTQIGNVNVFGLLLAGIILGAVGVLDDLCIGQASAVWELKEANKKFDFRELYTRAMNIGTDHISATVNTLVMAYVGAALPLVLLITQSKVGPNITFSSEVVATEIIRTLIGTLGLIFAVPITTLVAAYLVQRSPLGK